MRGALKQPVLENSSLQEVEDIHNFISGKGRDTKHNMKQENPRPYPTRGPHTKATNKFRLKCKARFNPTLKETKFRP